MSVADLLQNRAIITSAAHFANIPGDSARLRRGGKLRASILQARIKAGPEPGRDFNFALDSFCKTQPAVAIVRK